MFHVPLSLISRISNSQGVRGVLITLDSTHTLLNNSSLFTSGDTNDSFQRVCALTLKVQGIFFYGHKSLFYFLTVI